ncbi:orc1/cdc6 family replication initiation protein [Candidatus Woesearchaeota archaeon]|nr:orc1/cdc6 family replication initiation protein [Candidatus Woesearchaeota archaeon]
MSWYEEFDYTEDPFTESEKLFGLEKVMEELVYRVESGSMVFVEGRPGLGKSAVIKAIISHFAGRGKVIYFDCGQIEKRMNIENLMTGKYGLFGRLFGKKPKNMILLLDNSNFLTKKNCERIKHYFDNNFIKSVVFTGLSYSRAHFSKSLRDRIGGRIIRLKELTPEQAVELVRERASAIEMLTEDIIRKIYAHSGKNIKKFLSNLSEVCEKAVHDGDGKISDRHLTEVFGDKNEQ